MVNNISDIEQLNSGDIIEIEAAVTENKITKTEKSTFLKMTISDSTGSLSFPIFDSCLDIEKNVEVGNVYKIRGVVNKWNNTTQIKNVRFSKVDNYDKSRFIASYSEKSISEATDFILGIVKKLSPTYKELAETMLGLNEFNKGRFDEFKVCPSAVKHHGNKLGGLVVHTSNVVKNLLVILNNTYKDDKVAIRQSSINVDRLILKAIIHDIMKIKEYKYDVAITRKDRPLNHILDCVSEISKANDLLENKLSEDEIDNITYGILSHHGQYGAFELKSPEDTLLHISDWIDAVVVGEIQKAEKEVSDDTTN